MAAAALLHHLLGRAVKIGEKRVDRRAASTGVTSRSSFAASARNCASFMVASNAARSAALRSAGMSGVREERPAEKLARGQKPQHLPLLVVRRAIDRPWHLRDIGVLLHRELRQQIDLAAARPSGS